MICFLLVVGTFASCSSKLTNREDIIGLFDKNETIITESVQNNDLEPVKKIHGIQNVYVSEQPNYIDFECGGSGLGSSTHYYGFFYSPDDDLTAWNGGACPKGELLEDGKGFKWEQKDGDNKYYVEKIGDHFFYYEAHF